MAATSYALRFSSDESSEAGERKDTGFANAAPSAFAPQQQEATIGEMAREFGVSLRTLRFYEDRGLLHPRRAGTSRYYGGPDRFRLSMILKGKQLGFTLSEIAELVGAKDSAPDADIETQLTPTHIVGQIGHLERQRNEIEAAISRLRATHSRLSESSHI